MTTVLCICFDGILINNVPANYTHMSPFFSFQEVVFKILKKKLFVEICALRIPCSEL